MEGAASRMLYNLPCTAPKIGGSMATSATKVALGVGCGILLAVAIVMGSCVACFGYGASKVANEMEKQDQAKSQLVLEEGWEFAMGDVTGKVRGKVRNASDRQFNSVMIEFNLYDESGNQVGTAMDTVSNLEPGKTWSFEAQVFNEAASTAKFKGFTAF
jgi:hypothetical protein